MASMATALQLEIVVLQKDGLGALGMADLFFVWLELKNRAATT